MTCEHVRLLLGVLEELDDPTRRAVEAHIGGCASCAAAWAEELEFRRLMTSRRIPPGNPNRRRALMTVPPAGYGAWRASRLAHRLTPIAAAAVAMAAGWVGWNLSRPAPPPAPVQPAPAATVVLRQPASGQIASRVGRPEEPAAVPVAAASQPRLAPQPAPPAPASGPSTGASAEPAGGAPISSGPPAASSGADLPGGAGGSPANPPGITPVATPTGEPVLVRIVVVSDLTGGAGECPGCDGVGPDDFAAASQHPLGVVRVAWAPLSADGATGPETEIELASDEAGVAHRDVALPYAPGYAVRFVAADGGFVLCSTQASLRRLPSPTTSEGGLTVSFVVTGECPITALPVSR